MKGVKAKKRLSKKLREVRTKIESKPFHESIVDLIDSVKEGNGWSSRSITSSEQLGMLAMVILKTEILVGHDAIIAAWTAQCKKFWVRDSEDSGVLQDLKAKKAAAKKAARKKQQARRKA